MRGLLLGAACVLFAGSCLAQTPGPARNTGAIFIQPKRVDVTKMSECERLEHACKAASFLRDRLQDRKENDLSVTLTTTRLVQLSCTSDFVPPPLERAAACMLPVLKTTPGVHNAKLGVSTCQGWSHPYLEYEPEEKSRWVEPTRFEAHRSSAQGPYWFLAMVPGITTPGKALDYHVSQEVVRRWKAQCRVDATLLSE